MMNRRMAVSALTMGLMLSLVGTTPADAGQNGQKKDPAALELPITGTVVGGGTFTGTLSVLKFVVHDGQVAAIGMVRGTATSSAGAPLGTVLAGPISLPVSRPEPAGPIVTTTAVGAAVVAQATCQVVHIELGASTSTSSD